MYKFLIYISYPYAIPIGKPLQREIEKRGFTIKWFSDIYETNALFMSGEDVLQHIQDVIVYKPHVVLCATNLVPDFITGLKVQIFHGFNAQKRPSKKNVFSHFRIRGFFDLYCTQGPSTTGIFQQQQKKQPHFEVVETGWSKVDSLFPLDKRSENKIPNILIASTFTPRLSLAHNNDVFKTIKDLISLEIYQINMVLHPKMDPSIIAKWKSLNNGFFTFHDTTNLIPLFKEADILFADTTSAIQEFVLQKKPVVTYNNSTSETYLINITEPNKINEAFKYALQYPEEIICKIENSIKKLHPYYDGLSSQRIIDACLESIHKDKLQISNKPRNIIRKYKIRNQLSYFTLRTYRKPYTISIDTLKSQNLKDVVSSVNSVKLSAVIITFNEEEHIEKCLTSLVNVADEIVVVDSFSTDRTEAICKHFNVKFIQHSFEGYIEQKNFAITQASNDYILSLDGDEALSEKLKISILKAKQNWNCDGYVSNRLNNYCGKWIKHSDWYPDRKLRLFKKESGEWKGINPHDSYTLKKSKKCGKLKGDLYHWIYRDYSEHQQKSENFSTIASHAYYKLGIKSSKFKIYFRPSWAFFKSYFLRLGFIEGKYGYRICYQSYRTTYLKYKKLYKLWQESKV